jgi:glyoxylase-like metal-dependent hydrolase (beta-lactamase superfamily II)
VTIAAHEAARSRLATGTTIPALNRTVPPAPERALPTVTFDSRMTFHFAGHNIELTHVPSAHTDGDAVVYFRKVNVVHVGDLLFNGIYPCIDYGVGGSLEGMIATADRLLAAIDDKTKVIPGHGPVMDKAGLRAFRDMLAGVGDRIVPLVRAGKTKAEVVAAKPMQEWDGRWGKGFHGVDRFVELVYDGMTWKPPAK